MNRVTAKFTLNVGRFIAGTLERELRSAAFSGDLDLKIEKSMGLLEGVFFCTLSGPERVVDVYLEALEEMVKEHG